MKLCKGDSEKITSGIFIILNVLICIFGILLTTFSLIILHDDDDFKIEIQCDNAKEHHDNLEIGCLVLTAAGTLFFMISILGVVTAIIKYKFYLLVYVIGVIIAIILLIIGIVLSHSLFYKKITNCMNKKLVVGIQDDFIGSAYTYKLLPATDDVSLNWEQIFRNFGCCGLDSYKDFQKDNYKWSNKWNNDYRLINSSVNSTNNKIQLYGKIPIGCCKVKNDVWGHNTTFVNVLDCLTNPNSDNAHLNGCQEDMEKYRKKESLILIIFSIFEIFIALAALFCAFFLFYKARTSTSKVSPAPSPIPSATVRKSSKILVQNETTETYTNPVKMDTEREEPVEDDKEKKKRKKDKKKKKKKKKKKSEEELPKIRGSNNTEQFDA
ncbi:DgyrCDS8575 [Dimorphilus gyrociliatus]|uniref:DgyrCDS8575 n=1 Tax=Dimorphilus gyrociliatus TaxID=2664684 RepID=A0A7I8VUL4_9ANNE|nr:DgyrCDS8575 [Dimorphilus gyrociliatus]